MNEIPYNLKVLSNVQM